MTITKTIGRDRPDGVYLEITLELREGSADDRRGLSPAFSVTGSGWERHGTWSGRACARNGRDMDYCGCVHEEILEAAPELAPLVAVHLASPDGVPMHAEANGWYFYSGASAAWERQQVAAGRDYGYSRSLEVSDHVHAARALNIPAADLPAGLDREGFGELCRTLAGDRWPAQAAAARALLESIADGEGVEPRRYR